MYSILTEAERILAGVASPAMVAVDSRAGVLVATVREPAVSGQLLEIMVYNPDTGTYQTSSPTIDLGKSAGISCWGKNTGAYKQNLRVDIKVTKPSGATESKTGTVYTIDPGSSAAWMWTWVCTEVGQYKVDITLYAEAVV